MEPFKTAALAIHIIGGSVALLTGLYNMIARKGGRRHKRIGSLFAWSMYSVAFSAMILSLYIDSAFFFCLGVFTFYMTWNGQRSALLKEVVFHRWDRIVLLIGLANTVIMLIQGNMILAGLGVLSSTLVIREIVLFYKWSRGMALPKNTWLVRHIGMMVGSYISTITAFLVVNWDGIGPYWVPWALPPAILVPYIVWWSRKVSRPVRRRVVAASLLLLPFIGSAQPYVDGGATRHRFAQTTLGADLRYLSGGSVGERGMGGITTASILIGGTHFWGHADLLLAIPLASSGGREGVKEGVETIFKVYPWQIARDRFRPFVGGSWAMFSTRWGESVTLERMRVPLMAGGTFLLGSMLLDAGFRYLPRMEERLWVGPDHVVPLRLPDWTMTLSVRYMFDATLSAENGHASGRTRMITDTLASRGRLNGMTVAFGGGSAIFLERSTWLARNRPWLDDHRISNGYWHGSIGYYLHRPDLQFAISYRHIKDRLAAFGEVQEFGRRSISLEAYHFFADMHGFTPFLGACLSHEQLRLDHEGAEGTGFRSRDEDIRPGLVAGWDIRPNRLQAFLLRTQLRYILGHDLRPPGVGVVPTHQLEVDLIQLVLFPGRLL